MTLTPGQRFGPYEIVSRLGTGGMGEVWRARDTRLDRSVAVKVLPDQFASNAALRSRFEREAKTISQLNHPHICTLYDVGREHGVDYLVMELLEGESLAERLARGPLPLREVLRVGAQIAEALDCAHSSGVVHRDLKPANVMLTKAGAKLLDFGLAKTTIPAGPIFDGATEQKPLTTEGTIIGTFQYMAPEQLEGADADARTDIFAFGAVLYEMATGRRAFGGKTRTSVIAAIVSGEPQPIVELQPLTPPALEHLIARCLSKDPEERWQSARDVAQELRWIERAELRGAPAAARSARRAWLLAAAGALVLASAAGVAAFVAGRRTVRPAFALTIPFETSSYSSATDAIISPDGRTVVFSALLQGSDRRMIWTRRLDSVDAVPLTTGPLSTPQGWSTDGEWLLYTRGGQLYRMPRDGGASQPVGSATQRPAMNAEEVVLSGTASGPIMAAAPGQAPRPITALDISKHEVGHAFPSFLPDDRHFLFLGLVRDPAGTLQPHRLYVGDATGREKARYLTDVATRAEYAPPGHLLTVRDGGLVAIPFDARRLTITGTAIPVVDEVALISGGDAAFSVSRDGVLACAAVDRSHQIHWVTADGRVDATSATTDLVTVGALQTTARTRDGSAIAETIRDPKLGSTDIWVRDVRSGAVARATFGPNVETDPVFSPDGSRLYYSSDRNGALDIYEKRLDGPESARPILARPGQQRPKDVSPDGRFLLFRTVESSATSGDLYVLPLDGKGAPFPFVNTPASEGPGGVRFSPDGRWVVYVSLETGDLRVYVKRFPEGGQPIQVSVDEAEGPRWSEDGKTIYLISGKTLSAVPFDPATGRTGTGRVVFTLPFAIAAYEPMPDGRFVMLLASQLHRAPSTRVYSDWTRLLKK